ncbi:hypothetical protein [Streptomyces sp. NPDC004830]
MAAAGPDGGAGRRRGSARPRRAVALTVGATPEGRTAEAFRQAVPVFGGAGRDRAVVCRTARPAAPDVLSPGPADRNYAAHVR